MMLDDKIILVTGIGKGIGESIFHKCVMKAKFTYGIVRNNQDYKRLLKKYKNLNSKIFFWRY